jgi:hypothetical protein
VLDQPPLSIALWGARHPTQLDEIADVMGWKLGLKSTALSSIASAIREEFMAPPARLAACICCVESGGPTREVTVRERSGKHLGGRQPEKRLRFKIESEN